MNCVKCGREIGEEQAFCPDCLKEMEQYPVKPGTVVHIPKRADADSEKKMPVRRKPVLSAEEQVARLKKKVLWLRLTVAMLLLACGLLCYGIGRAATELDLKKIIGQNYSTIESAGPATRDSGKP